MKHALLGTAVVLGLITSLCGWRWAYTSLRVTRNSENITENITDISEPTRNITDTIRVTKNITDTPTNFSNNSTNITITSNNTVDSQSNFTTMAETLTNPLPSSLTKSLSTTDSKSGKTEMTSASKGGSKSLGLGDSEATASGIPVTRTVPALGNVIPNGSIASNSTDELQDINYVKMGQKLLVEATTMLNFGVWNFERRTEDGDAIFSRQLDNGKMVYRLTGIVDMPAQNLLVIIYDGLADYPKWNPSLIECRVLEKINDQTDISYTVSAPGARGYVASRDFVSLRHWDLHHNTYVAASKSIDFPRAPSNPDYIRGHNGPGCMELRPLNSDPNKTEFRWLLNTRLNGWIPAYIADKAYKKFMTKYMVFLRDYCEKIKQRASDSTPSSTTPTNITN